MVPLQEKKFIYDKVYEILGEIVFIVQILLSFLVLIFILYTISRNIRKQTTQYGPMLLKIGMVVLALSTYHFWTVEIADLILEIARYVDDEKGFITVYNHLYEALVNAWKNIEFSWSWGSLGNSLLLFMHHFLIPIVLFLCLFMIACGEAVFTLGQFFIQALLWMFGPIAIVISLVPMYADNFKRWLQNFIAVNFWSVIYAALTRFFYHIITEEVRELLSRSSEQLGIFYYIGICAYSLTFFYMVLWIPYITKYIIPSPPGLPDFSIPFQKAGAGLHKGIPKMIEFVRQLKR